MRNVSNFLRSAVYLLVLAVVISACDSEYPCVRGKGDVETRELSLDNFTRISNNSSAKVTISAGTTQKVVVKGQANILDIMRTNVSGGRWEIDFTDCINNARDLEVNITLPVLQEVNNNGSGDMIVYSKFSSVDVLVNNTGSGNTDFRDSLYTTNFRLINTGSGDVRLPIIVQTTKVENTGSGKIYLSGSTDTQDVKITGSGEYYTFGLLSKIADITTTGSGDAEVSVSDRLKATTTGSGNIYYKGNPVIESTSTGSGKVINRN